jgi:hypothetical protein
MEPTKSLTVFEYNEIRTKLIMEAKSMFCTLEQIEANTPVHKYLQQDTAIIENIPEMLIEINNKWLRIYNKVT